MSATTRTLADAHADVKAEIARTDTKTGLLLAFVGAVLAGVLSVGQDLPLNAFVLATAAAGLAVLVAAAGLLLWSVRPNLGGRTPVGFPLWATLTPEDIGAALAGDLADAVAGLSRIAVGKFTCLRRAVDLTLTGCALLVLAALIMLGGAA